MNFKSILAIGAHPDDVEYSCFGYLTNQRNNGSNIHVFIASPDSLSDGSLMDTRIEESKNAFSLIPGANINFRFKNNITNDDYQSLSDEIRQLVIKNNIDVVLVHSKNDTMQEHRLLHDITITALRRLPVSIFLYKSPSVSSNFDSNLIIDIENEYKLKLKALSKHKSQSDKDYMSEEYIKVFNQGWQGKKIGIDLYEEFYIYRLIK